MNIRNQNIPPLVFLLLFVLIIGCSNGPTCSDNSDDDNDVLNITTIAANPYTVETGTFVVISMSYSYDGDSHVSIEWSCENGQIYQTGSSGIIYWLSPNSEGTFRVYVYLSDGEYTAHGSVNINVIGNPIED